MSKLIKNMISLSLKEGVFKRCIVYAVLSSLYLVVLTRGISKILPQFVLNLVTSAFGDGEINFGFIKYESLEQIKNMSVSGMVRLAYQSPFAAMVSGILAVELVTHNFQDGYFQFLISRGTSREKVYISRLIASSTVATLIYLAYGLSCRVLSMLAFRNTDSTMYFSTVIFRIIGLWALVVFFSCFATIIRRSTGTIVFAILAAIGGPSFVDFFAKLFGSSGVRYIWIGDCTACFETSSIPIVIIMSVIYIGVFGVAGTMLFKLGDLKQ